jgi:hypothetical protein
VLGRDFAELASDRMVRPEDYLQMAQLFSPEMEGGNISCNGHVQAAVMGTARQLAVSINNCGICGGEVHHWLRRLSTASHAASANGGYSVEAFIYQLKACVMFLFLHQLQLADARSHISGGAVASGASVQLQCKHLFHPLCIRGWTMVGEPTVLCACTSEILFRSVTGQPQPG